MNPRLKELVDMVTMLRAEAPDLPLPSAIALAIAAQQTEIADDMVIVLGDIADALNDMRPHARPSVVH